MTASLINHTKQKKADPITGPAFFFTHIGVQKA
jgi:hypothetical protein